MKPDPVINEIRDVRQRISARFDHDPVKLVNHYIELQKLHQDRLIKPADQKTEPDQTAA